MWWLNVGVSLSYLFKDFSVAVALSIFCLISRRKSESTNKDCFCLLLLLLLLLRVWRQFCFFSYFCFVFLLGCHWSSWIERRWRNLGEENHQLILLCLLRYAMLDLLEASKISSWKGLFRTKSLSFSITYRIDHLKDT